MKPLCLRERGWGEGGRQPSGLRPAAPLIPTLLPQGEKGFRRLS
ncbi:hypothetical protein [Azospirillum doebereinerae]